eukprot:513936-Rhodomonas_salina.1
MKPAYIISSVGISSLVCLSACHSVSDSNQPGCRGRASTCWSQNANTRVPLGQVSSCQCTLYFPHENTGAPVRKCWQSLGHVRSTQHQPSPAPP